MNILDPPKGFTLGPKMSFFQGQKVLKILSFLTPYTWRDNLGNATRQTFNFGWDYSKLESGEKIFVEPPQEIKEAKQALVLCLKDYLPKGLKASYFDNIIITEYKKGQHLMAHYDADQNPNPITPRNFSFAEPIVGWVIEADLQSTLTFYHHPKKGRPLLNDPYFYKTHEENGSTFILENQARHYPFFHGIPPVKNARVSMTLRKTIFPT